MSTVERSFNDKDTAYIYNHLEFTVFYHSADKSDWGHNLNTPTRAGRIVRINVTPYSIDHDAQGGKCEHGPSNKPLGILGSDLRNKNDGKIQIKYTYSVQFEARDDIKWSSRWDYLLQSSQQTNIQWFSILNACIIVLFLSGMVGMTLMRTLHKDIIKYNQLESADDAQEEFGWKLVHGDVFRPPRYAMLLSVLLGSGVQVIIMAMITLIFACLGFLSPANRGALMTTALLLYVTLGTPAGYVSARLYKMFGGLAWKQHVLMTALFCPGVIFAIFFAMNLILWSNESSSAVPFSTLLALLSMWFGISVPLTFVGAYYGFRKPTIEQPVRTNQIPRQVPEQTFYTKPVPSIIMGGILPFGCIFIQLYFILTSVWAHQTYYMFGFLFLVFIILIVTCSETTILLCYFHLCAEDYRWWWRAFLTSGCTAFYFFLYAMNFYSKSLTVSGFFFLLTGTIGFFASFWFVRKIFSAIKVD